MDKKLKSCLTYILCDLDLWVTHLGLYHDKSDIKIILYASIFHKSLFLLCVQAFFIRQEVVFTINFYKHIFKIFENIFLTNFKCNFYSKNNTTVSKNYIKINKIFFSVKKYKNKILNLFSRHIPYSHNIMSKHLLH